VQIYIYLRSADAPDRVDIRLIHLQDTATDRGWMVAGVHVDRAIGATRGRNRLPGLAAMLNAVARHEVDVVMVWSLHHLSTSLDGLLDTLAELHRHGVKLVVHDQPDDGTTVDAGGLLSAADLLVDARRAYRRENIIAGQIRAKACGTRFGRPPVPPAKIEKVRSALRSGQGVRQAARSSGISPAKASRIRSEMIGAGLMG
jgi:DNA invertase Pin-like site-specific DNA recombinase